MTKNEKNLFKYLINLRANETDFQHTFKIIGLIKDTGMDLVEKIIMTKIMKKDIHYLLKIMKSLFN